MIPFARSRVLRQPAPPPQRRFGTAEARRGPGRQPRAVLAWLCLLCVVVAFPAAGRARRRDTVEDLTARIERENNPVKKAKLKVRLARLETEQAASAYDRRQVKEGQRLLSASASEMQGAWSLLEATGRNAAKKPDGFMQLEIGAREDTRLLNQLRQRTFYLYRAPIDDTLKTLNDIHSKVLVALFPGATPPAKRNASGAKAPAYQHPDGGVHP